MSVLWGVLPVVKAFAGPSSNGFVLYFSASFKDVTFSLCRFLAPSVSYLWVEDVVMLTLLIWIYTFENYNRIIGLYDKF